MESNSISNQKILIDKYISNKQDLKLVDYYIDDGYSGTNFNRPAFKKLLQDITNEKINTIIVKDLSRLGRNHIEVDNYLENIFPMMNVRFISIIENIDSYHIREKVLGKCSDDINEKWNAKMINRILKNRTYIGDLIQGKKKVKSYRNHKLIDTNEEEWIITKNHHEPIISEEKFNKVQEIIENNNARINKDGKVDLFYGYLKCGDCGSKFKKSGEYYYCESYARYKKCTKHSVNRNKLISKVEENIKIQNKNIKKIDRKVLF